MLMQIVPMSPSSLHLIADYSGCDRTALKDSEAIENLLLQAAEAAKATVITHFSHHRADGGISSVVIIQESHLTVRTFPDAGYAAADFFTCGQSDAHAAQLVLLEGLGAEASKVFTIDRGGVPARFPYVRGHRRVTRVNMDCRGDNLPEGVRVGHSPGRGLGLFATRDFEIGDEIYVCESWLASFDTVFQIDTDVGQTLLTADELGCELTMQEMEHIPESMKKQLAEHYGLQNPADLELREYMTGDREREVIVSSFDGLVTDSEDPNLDDDYDSIKLSFDGDEPHWYVTMIAIQPIKAGDEIFLDDSDSRYFQTPEDWKK